MKDLGASAVPRRRVGPRHQCRRTGGGLLGDRRRPHPRLSLQPRRRNERPRRTLGGDNSRAFRVNDAGQVVGISATGNGPTRLSLQRDTGMKDLGTLGGPNSHRLGINNAGQVVGFADCDRPRRRLHSRLPLQRRKDDRPELVGGSGRRLDPPFAAAINDSGQIAGFGTAPDGTPGAFLLTPLKGLGIRD